MGTTRWAGAVVGSHLPATGDNEGETKEGKMRRDREEESSPLHPGLFLARLTGDQQLASALHAETQQRAETLPRSLALFPPSLL